MKRFESVTPFPTPKVEDVGHSPWPHGIEVLFAGANHVADTFIEFVELAIGDDAGYFQKTLLVDIKTSHPCSCDIVSINLLCVTCIRSDSDRNHLLAIDPN